ncbi:MAG: hypothetical protein MUF78_03325 [Candidatus Edwardsbacteria bacterium]|jgi:hypothetical protein|nr:hypothetical protein [Candidatus Edwardsbacteria bacterium]
MDEALKRIERALAGRTPASRIDPLLPKAAPPQAPADDMAITHLSKGAAQPERVPAEATVPDHPAAAPDPAAGGDIYQKISAGGREFSLDELGSGDAGGAAADPLMGPMLKPASSYRDVSLDELDVNITPDGPQPKP